MRGDVALDGFLPVIPLVYLFLILQSDDIRDRDLRGSVLQCQHELVLFELLQIRRIGVGDNHLVNIHVTQFPCLDPVGL
jgi:hypothetical protein